MVLAGVTIHGPEQELRSGCEADSAVVARLTPHDEIRIRFAVNTESGRCYKVSTLRGEGYLPESALAGAQEFEAARRAGAFLEVVREVKAAPGGSEPLAAAVRLLESHQPGEALRLLEKELGAGSKDPQVLAMAGVAAYRADDLRRAAWYLQQSLELRPNAAVRQVHTKVLQELSADQGAERKFGSRFALRYDGNAVSEDAARAMVEALEQEYWRITAELGCRWSERINVIVQTPQAYRRAFEAAEWSAGRYDGRIHVALLEAGVGPRTRQAFAHELTHACLATLGPWPSWLHEGLAQKLSGATLAPGLERRALAALKAGKLPRLDRISQDWSRLSAEHAAKAYALTLAAVEILYASYGRDGVRNILNHPSALPQITEFVQRRLAE